MPERVSAAREAEALSRQGAAARAGRLRRVAAWLVLSAAVVVLDQVSKVAARVLLAPYDSVAVVPGLDLTLVFNSGAAFSFLAGAGGWQRWFFVVLATVISGGLVIWLSRLPARDRLAGLSLSLILGGAVGNLIDRLLFGHVTDFIDLYYRDWHWPAFNVADSAITVGAVLMVLDSLFAGRRQAGSD